ncbi:DUF6573 family protein [Leptospira stimsonii]|uniref:Uncharacterized protein n=1 Tax=Leptospira stimsonii TaxID=2202203 RepID=A0ABY2N4Q9_9LEPT|nr:DUF6573 family protein [Leptospira stimsonii]TGK12926.1 hypothetical protein EHO98_19275 [Leptospira stimsonii]TGM16913.1 hypothetical protein EHQ90_08410 [Leptospira stimsonii]
MDDFEIIDSYTRAEAIKDGGLIDLSSGEFAHLVKRIYKYPLAATAGVWHEIRWIVEISNDQVLFENVIEVMLKATILNKTKIIDESSHLFRLNLSIPELPGPSFRDFKIICGPGDDLTPVLTILLPEED